MKRFRCRSSAIRHASEFRSDLAEEDSPVLQVSGYIDGGYFQTGEEIILFMLPENEAVFAIRSMVRVPAVTLTAVVKWFESILAYLKAVAALYVAVLPTAP